ncbi:LacI family DNA-binding transcriptional regulator [Kitasatospora purpeofusca]|uniref:LacI family DNA-binding transcriptional regulator n=1 Tax=Kitasatospora purpeofusca TaxID=67352 RepID=UPI00386B3B88|nr:LacI family transcriptional regulator [Kitasatospora purpeofusca]
MTTPGVRPARRVTTIADVARAAEVSRQTVSNALNAPHRVRPDTLARVNAAIERLGYRPDQSARSLRTGERRTIGYLAPVDDPFDPNPLMAGFLEALVDAAGAVGHHVLLLRPAAGEQDVRAVIDGVVAARQVDGLVLADVLPDDPRAAHAARVGIPFAAFGRTGPGLPQHWADIDNVAATAEVARHLAARGHRRVAFVGVAATLPWLAARREGFHHEAARLGLSLAPTPPAGGLRALLRDPDRPTALATDNDLAALDIYEAARAEGLQVGRDLAVTGFHDTPLARHLHPPLTSMRLPLRTIATTVVTRLLAQLRSDAPVGAEGVELAAELVVRESSAGAAPGS